MTTARTLTCAEEAVGVARAAVAAGIPSAISFTVETDGRLPSGQPLGEAIAQVDDATGGAPAYFMINCAHPTHVAGALEPDAAWAKRIHGLRLNASTRSHAELETRPRSSTRGTRRSSARNTARCATPSRRCRCSVAAAARISATSPRSAARGPRPLRADRSGSPGPAAAPAPHMSRIAAATSRGGPDYPRGLMFWFRRNRLVGSYLVFERDQAFVVGGAVAGAHQLLALLAEAYEVEVGTAVRVVLHVGPEGARPVEGSLVVGRILPDRIDAQHPAHVAIAEGGGVTGHAADRAAHVPDRAQRPVGRAVGRARRDLVYHRVVQAVEIDRLEVGAMFSLGEQPVEQLLHLAVGHLAREVEQRGGQDPQRLNRRLALVRRPGPDARPGSSPSRPKRPSGTQDPPEWSRTRPGCRRSRPARLP